MEVGDAVTGLLLGGPGLSGTPRFLVPEPPPLRRIPSARGNVSAGGFPREGEAAGDGRNRERDLGGRAIQGLQLGLDRRAVEAREREAAGPGVSRGPAAPTCF